MTRPAPWRLDPSAYPVAVEFGTRYQDLDTNGNWVDDPGYGQVWEPTVDPGWAPYDTASRTTALLSETTEATDDPAGDERARWDTIR